MDERTIKNMWTQQGRQKVKEDGKSGMNERKKERKKLLQWTLQREKVIQKDSSHTLAVAQ